MRTVAECACVSPLASCYWLAAHPGVCCEGVHAGAVHGHLVGGLGGKDGDLCRQAGSRTLVGEWRGPLAVESCMACCRALETKRVQPACCAAAAQPAPGAAVTPAAACRTQRAYLSHQSVKQHAGGGVCCGAGAALGILESRLLQGAAGARQPLQASDKGTAALQQGASASVLSRHQATGYAPALPGCSC